MNPLSILLTLSLLLCFARVNAQLATCADNSFLNDIFFAAGNHQCIVARITYVNGAAHTTSYSEGSLYYNRYTNSLNNLGTPDNQFPVVDSSYRTCFNGIEQPFATIPTLGHLATHYFDININRTGYVTFQSNNVITNQFPTYCYHNYSIGVDSNGVVYIFEFQALPIELPCPAPFGKECLGVGSTNSCLSTQIYTGGQCYYRTCAELDCGNHICINDGGIARCISSTIAPTNPPASSNPTRQVPSTPGRGYATHPSSPHPR